MRGKFITIEGTEGAGKSTALQFIEAYLTEKNIHLVLTREPGGTEIAEEIRNLLLFPKSNEKIEPETELLLMFAARVQHLKQCILPSLNKGIWVISDRYIDASFAYQGGGRGLNIDTITMLDKFFTAPIYPDLTLLLDVPVQMGIARAENRGTNKDRIEQEKIDFFVNVREAYFQRAQSDPHRIKIINSMLDLEAVQLQIKNVLDVFLESTVT